MYIHTYEVISTTWTVIQFVTLKSFRAMRVCSPVRPARPVSPVWGVENTSFRAPPADHLTAAVTTWLSDSIITKSPVSVLQTIFVHMEASVHACVRADLPPRDRLEKIS